MGNQSQLSSAIYAARARLIDNRFVRTAISSSHHPVPSDLARMRSSGTLTQAASTRADPSDFISIAFDQPGIIYCSLKLSKSRLPAPLTRQLLPCRPSYLRWLRYDPSSHRLCNSKQRKSGWRGATRTSFELWVEISGGLMFNDRL